jgi:hypothetical protein
VSGATAIRDAHRERSPQEIAESLRAEWRMIAGVTLRPSADGVGFEAALRLDQIVVKGSLEQQGNPRTPEALERIERRRHAALDQCVQDVNQGLPDAERIRAFTVIG